MGGPFRDPFPSDAQSIREIARKLNADKETVRNRLLILRRKGILLGSHMMVNPRLLSLAVTRFWCQFSSEALKQDVIKRLTQMENVSIIYDYFGDSLSFVAALSTKDPESQTEGEEFSSLFKNSFSAVMKFPMSKVTLSKDDWKIYRSLRDNPKKLQSSISGETGLTDRTLKRRLSALTEGNAFLISPELDSSRIDGVATELLVKYSNNNVPEVIDEVQAEVENYLIHVERFEEPCILFSLITANFPKAHEIREKVKVVPGVIDAQLYVVQEAIRPSAPLMPRKL